MFGNVTALEGLHATGKYRILAGKRQELRVSREGSFSNLIVSAGRKADERRRA